MMDPTSRGIKWAVWIAVTLAPAALAGEPVRLSTDGAMVRLGQPEDEPRGLDQEVAPPARYGAEGTQWILFGGGAAYDLEDSTDLNINAAYSVFLIDDVEWMMELGGWYHAQAGDDAASLNPVMEFRWHFFNNGSTSVFLNAGIGLLFATDEVPDGGTAFDFTPRAGIGLTQLLGASGNRLVAGLRWHHISNARINGEEENPSRDAPMVYVQLAVPF